MPLGIPVPPRAAAGSYTRLAFWNPYNLSLLGGAALIAFVGGEWWVGLAAGGLESAWLLLAPESTWLRRVWLEPAACRAHELGLREGVDERLRSLPPSARSEGHRVLDQALRVRALAAANPSLKTTLMESELARLDDLALDYAATLERAFRVETHLSSIDVAALEGAFALYDAQRAGLHEHDPRHAVALKNLEALGQRRARYTELVQLAGSLRGQLDLVDTTLRLLVDEIVSASAPTSIATRIDEVHEGLAAARVVTSEIEGEPLFADDCMHHTPTSATQNRT